MFPRRILLCLALLVALNGSALFASSQENISQEYTCASGGHLVVEVAFGGIEISAGADDKVSIEGYRKIEAPNEALEKKYFAEVPITIAQDGKTITLRARRLDQKSWDWPADTKMEAHYVVRVPKKFQLEINTGGGPIAARGTEGAATITTGGGKLKLDHLRGPLNAKTSGGNIVLSNCEGGLEINTSGGGIEATDSSGKLDARTAGGSISVRNFNGDASVRTSGGRLDFENVNGRVSGKTSGGSISASLLSPVPGDVELVSSAGSIDVMVAKNAGFNVEAEASVGAIANDLPIAATRTERDELRGAINGGGKSVVLRSSAGSISIRGISANSRTE